MQQSIEAVKLTKKYGSFTALSDLNLKLEGAKCIGFLGPNGAGKTTTLKLFTDMIRPSEGHAMINGIDVHSNKRSALSSCAALIETPEIYPSLTPMEALSMIAEIRGVPSEEQGKRIEESLSEVKMLEWKDKKVGKFSKGMKQRVNIASVLISDPDIIMLDEPTTGLDPRGMSEVREIVKSLKRKNRLIFMSSHLLNEVTDVCDEVAMIDHGKLLAYDTISNVILKFSENGSNVIEIGFSRIIDDSIMAEIGKLSNVKRASKIDETNIRIEISGDIKVQEELLYELARMKIGMISFKPSASALENTYLNMIKEAL
ncbi:MAG: ABC transporter ATP-binding protein [Nitrososphaerota archaeon]|jgi:ABC-2 type transport system ATP-binding protein|nr:ABC transporter ATP-binding protein [Nitrososphaerota archaeon]MDG6926860.1 ABC transporter ATP-binding protein [Nitrososphaerota archaeon]MDG6930022.1 ABC transporter ATP-binding protein [Nitrososphaerota archaeon]MDG6931973.1 ABC transporter ATP-binding protein [Nitrososphaerota archaeon]MDG6943824.1 ABC transporter ATP-binding protein [Nitrososphaerota archaeon]